jgi:tRNA 2-thiouridine synthesizing protein A
LKVVATDPGSVKDFQAFCKQTGHALLEQAEAEKVYTFFMKHK